MSVMEEPKRTPTENKTQPKQKKIKTHDIDTKEKKPLIGVIAKYILNNL